MEIHIYQFILNSNQTTQLVVSVHCFAGNKLILEILDTVFTLNIGNSSHTVPKIWVSPFYNLLMCLKLLDETQTVDPVIEAVSDLSLQSFLRPVRPST